METLTRLNEEMNGHQSSTAVSGKDDAVPRDVAYAVAEVARMLGDTAHVIQAWAVDTAWAAILAGDIDDLAEHVELARAARPPGRRGDEPRLT